MRVLRLLGVGWLYQLKMISRSPFEGFGQVIYKATTLTFTCDTGDFMLRARVADALMTVCDHGEWRRCFAPED